MEAITLNNLAIGQKATIITVGGEGILRRRFLDMGLTPKTRVMVRKRAPLGDPIEIFLRGYELTLRLDDAKKNYRAAGGSMKLTFALVGNQNCGKSTLFNYLTGSNQHVGNFPGVTVQKKEGILLKDKDITVIDLPGIYSLSPYTSEEIVTRDLLLRNKPDVIVNVLDATNIERSLYLSLQLIELNTPMVIALNMMDELQQAAAVLILKRLRKNSPYR